MTTKFIDELVLKPNKSVIHIPSTSIGAFGTLLKNGHIVKNNHGLHHWAKEFPDEFKFPFFLYPAAHYGLLKEEKIEKNFIDMKFNNDMLLMGDSGGFQIASGALKYSDDLRDKIFHFLDNYCNLAVNLDLPPKKTSEVKPYLEKSFENFKIFEKKQSGNSYFLNVLQSLTLESSNLWFNTVKDLNFNGWALANVSSSPIKLIYNFAMLLDNKEHLNPNNKIIHILGTSNLEVAAILSRFQKHFNENFIKIQITSDSSSPSQHGRFGRYVTNFNLKNCSWDAVHLPKADTFEFEFNDNPVIRTCHWDYYVDDIMTNKFLTNSGPSCAYVTLHNTFMVNEGFKQVSEFTMGELYTIQQQLPKHIYELCKIIDELFNSSSPLEYFEQNKIKIQQFKFSSYSNLTPEALDLNEFFD